MDLGGAFASWLVGQLQNLPLEMLSGGHLSAPQRLLELVYGEQEAEAVRAILREPAEELARDAAVIIPGIMGSQLASIRGISTVLWANPTLIADGHLNLLELDDAGSSDRAPNVEIVPVGVEKLTYLKLIVSTARRAQLYEFPYDWRRALEHNARILRDALARWSGDRPERRYVLVGHSMGGLLARTYLALYPQEAERRIARVIMIGTPLQGAPLGVLAFAGAAPECQIVARLHRDNDVPRLVSSMPASYQLLPPPAELFVPERAYPTNWNLYDARAWRLSHVRQEHLDRARAWHALLARSDTQVPLVEIAGCHRATVTDVWQAEGERDAAGGYTIVDQDDGADSGDDSVPLWSTRLPGVTTYYLEGNHQALPGHAEVLAAIGRLLRDEAPDLPTDLPEPSGLWRRLRAAPLAQQAAELRQRIESGAFSREDLERIRIAR